jgi:hypothetical protein
VAKFYTLEGYDKNKTLQKRKANPDKSPVYFNDYEMGSWLSAALKLPPLHLPSIVAAMTPSFPPIPLPPLPQLPPLPPLPSFSLPNIFPPIPTPVISVPSLPPLNIPSPNITASLPKIELPEIPSMPPIKIEPQIPKMDLRPNPQGMVKVGDTLQAAGGVTTLVGKGLVEVGAVLSPTGIGGFIAGVGGGAMAVGAGVAGAGTIISKAGTSLQTAQSIIQNKDIIGGLKAISETSGNLGLKDVSEATNTAVNVANQGQNIGNALSTGSPTAIVNTVNGLLNQSGVSPQITDRISQGTQMIETNQSFLSKNPYADEIYKLQSLNIKKDPSSIITPLKPIFKDPVNDPTHPLYIPPPPSSGKIPSSKPINLPSNATIEKQKSDTNIGIFLVAGLGFYLFTQNKKGKKRK